MIYLDNAATSYPKPRQVYERVSHVLKDIGGNPGRSSHTMAIEASRVVFGAREALAGLFNIADSGRISFTKNATEAINIALKGILKPGDHVITTGFEHNSVARTLRRLEKQGVSVTRIKARIPGLIDPEDIDRAITPKTKLVTVVHASNVFGTIAPLAKIAEVARQRGVLLMADSAQTAGAIPIDVECLGIDILAVTGHKALFGPQGTGALYLGKGIEPEPLIDGGTGMDDNISELPDRLETGTLNTPGIGGLAAGVEFILKEGISRIRAYERGLIELLLEGLKKIKAVSIIGTMDAGLRVGLVSFTLEGMTSDEVGIRLDKEFSIMTRCGTHCAPEAHRCAGTLPEGAVRVSPGYFTSPDEIEKFLEAITMIAKA
ncbi:MAG: aminotransferase class V-fold PLP-dependent enzyme [Deltaproteobacteria bacterium]|nr:aminotransferase class V-fold PLP-dependent enzyme [Deltaproteobacteria bacterium]